MNWHKKGFLIAFEGEMIMRNFDEWLGCFRSSISSYKYYIDFSKIYRNVDTLKIELNILNSLIGEKDIKNKYLYLLKEYPNTLKCIPILLAVRTKEIEVTDKTGKFYRYDFLNKNYSEEQYCVFMEETGLFDLLQNHLINNLVDYVLGVEAGLDSNARKNRGGHLMEDLVESFIKKSGFSRNVDYYKEMYASEIMRKWHIDLSPIINNGEAEKRFDFVIKGASTVYCIETNFYQSSGSKLNETARSYKTLALEANNIKGMKFVWITDGYGWKKAKKNLKETFDVLETIYNINEMEQGVFDSFKL